MAKSKPKSKKGKKKSGVTVDFEGVESGGRTIADGWATAKIVDAELTEAESSGNEMFKIEMDCRNGKEKAKVWDNLVLTPSALWKLRSVLEAAGVEVPEGEMDISADDLLDLEFDVEITNEEYEGKDRPRATAYAPLGTHTEESDDDEDEEEDEDDEDEAPPKKKGKKSKAKDDDDEEDDEDDDSEDDDSDDDEDDDSDEDDDEDDDDDDEDEEPPKRRGKSKSKSKAKDDEDDEDDDSDDDDEDSDEDDEDDDDDEEEDDEDEDEKPKKRSIKDKKGKKSKLRAGTKVSFEHKGKTKKGVITSIDGNDVFVEDSKGGEWELELDEITVIK